MTETTLSRSLTGDYVVDQVHSHIGFVARHAMVTKVRGTFDDFEATAHLDAEDPTRSTVKVVIQAASVHTRNDQRDEHLRNNDFFDMANYPEITFESTAVEKVDDEHYKLTGDLTIRGVTKPVTIDFAFQGSVSKAACRSTARTGASTGTPRWRLVACWSARRRPWSSRSPPSSSLADPRDPSPIGRDARKSARLAG
jgi:polyisoprenoid-binding protein YceI